MKKFLSIITTLALCLSMLPVTALAAENDPETYTVTVYGGTGGGDYEVGEDVIITAIVPEGMRFRFWIVEEGNVILDDPSSEETMFVMPASDITVRADYVDIAMSPTRPVTYPVIGGNIYFNATTGEITRCDRDVTIVEIPSTINGVAVTSIGDRVFSNCYSLTSVKIPDSVTSIGDGAFEYCMGLTDISVDPENPNYASEEGVLFDKQKSVLIQYPTQKSNSSYAIPDSVTCIGDMAFGYCSSLTNVTIPDSVTSIGDGAFCGCDLTSVMIPDSVTSIGDRAFSGCSNLTSVMIPDSVTSIGDRAFSGCSSLTSITIPDGVTSIDGAFSGCSSLTSITIPDSVTSIGEMAFARCSSLTSITIPNSVTSIGDGAFTSCDSLTDITIPNSVTSIGDRAFASCDSLTDITIPDSVTSIGEKVFSSCSNLTDIVVDPENPNYASKGGVLFDKQKSILICYPAGKSSLSYAIPYGVTSIGDSAFDDCSGLVSIMIPNSVTSIGDGAFGGCSGLRSVRIPDSITNIERVVFAGCSSLSTVTIPDGITSIGDRAFADCSSLTSVTIPTSVASIWDSAFSWCPKLTDVYYAGSESQWEEITIEHSRFVVSYEPFGSATIHFNSTGPAIYTVTVNDGAGSGDYAVGETVAIKAIVPEGMRFRFWAVDESDVTLADPDSEETTFIMPASDVVVTATYKDIETYRVHVNDGWGSGRYEVGETVTIRASYRATAFIRPDPNGMRFTGWIVEEGDAILDDPYSEVTTFIMPARDVVVTANYEDVVIPPVSQAYTITFDANGGTVTPGTMTTGEDGRLAELPTPVRDGYSFDGWFTTPDGGEKITVDRVFTEDTRVYANWTYNSSSGGDIWYPFPDNASTPPSTAPKTYPVTSPAASGGEIGVSPANAKKGDTVTVTVTPDDGYELGKLTVTDSKGNVLELTDAGDGRYTFIMPDSKVTVDAEFTAIAQQEPKPVWTNSFTDVDTDAWYYDALKFVSENGLMNGLSADQFAPNANLSRAQLAQILYNKEGKPAVSDGNAFTDVAAGAWYADAVTWAAANHIVGGYGDGAFGPDDHITREQLAVMLWRYAGEPLSVREISFSDADQISGFAQAAVRWAVENGILNGKGSGILDPRGFATRAEVAQMLKNYLDN